MRCIDDEGGNLVGHAQASVESTRNRRLDAGSWIVLATAILVLLFSLGVGLYRISLPSDGWVSQTPISVGGGYTFERSLFAPSPFLPGDRLIAVDGQPVSELTRGALAFDARRPAEWAEGAIVPYTVERSGEEITLDVTLRRLPLRALFELIPGPFQFLSLPFLLGSLAVFLLRPRESAARLFFLLFWFLVATGLHESVGPADLFSPALFWMGKVVHGALLWAFAIAPIQVHFFLVFPLAKPFLRQHPRWVPAVLYGLPPALFIGAVLLGGPWPEPFLPVVRLFDLAVFAVAVPANLASVIHSFWTVRDETARAQLRWAAMGLVIGLGGTQILFLIQSHLLGPTPWITALMLLFILLFPLSIAIAIMRFRLWDIDLIINRSLVNGGLTGVVLGIYMVLVGGFGLLFQARGNPLVSLLATGFVAVLFQPLRERLQRTVNRLMYGQRDEPYAVLSQLGRRLEGAFVPGEVLPIIVEAVAEALKLPHAAVELEHDGAFSTAASYGEPAGEPLVLPLGYQSERLGRLLLSPRHPGESFRPTELRLLEDLTRHAGVAIYAARLTADLQLGRQRLVTAREEERRRLHRDLHDGLGPHLAGLTLKLEGARNRMTQDPATAALLTEVAGRIQSAVADIRRLVYDLRPPALDELGLVQAIEESAMSGQHDHLVIKVEGPTTLPPLPAAVEVAAYRIAQEAISNVLRHSGATLCRVVIALDQRDGLLSLSIEDNGHGGARLRPGGVGLGSMRERAEELGGSLALRSDRESGTRVIARLPWRRDDDETGPSPDR